MNWDSTVVDNTAARRFEIQHDGKTAVAEYIRSPGIITFTHTLVPPEFRGKGIGTALIRVALATARAAGLKVVPRCAFFAQYMQAHPETHDLRA